MGDPKAEKINPFDGIFSARGHLGSWGPAQGLESGQEGTLEGFGGVASKYFSGYLSGYLSRYLRLLVDLKAEKRCPFDCLFSARMHLGSWGLHLYLGFSII